MNMSSRYMFAAPDPANTLGAFEQGFLNRSLAIRYQLPQSE